ncbi:hypothetical protein FACS1894187_10800 [Synergistales bacterium]|nr:hypothetical protein FACS1894187_10800 [Synergistales bacterium]
MKNTVKYAIPQLVYVPRMVTDDEGNIVQEVIGNRAQYDLVQDEHRTTGIGIIISVSDIFIHPQLWGRAATWDEVCACLYWGEDNVGEELEANARIAAEEYINGGGQWRIEKHVGMSGAIDYRIYLRYGEISAEEKELALKGNLVTTLHVSCAGKLNNGVGKMSLEVWYFLLKTIPATPWPDIENQYRNYPPKKLEIKAVEWNSALPD